MKRLGVLFLGLVLTSNLAFAQKATPQIQQEINQYIQSNNQNAISGYILNGILNDIAVSYANNANIGPLQPGYSSVLGLGSAANQSIGTSGATLCLLNANCTWSGTQTFPAGSAAANLGFTPAQVVNIKDYGAILDGASHPVSGYFGNAAAAEAVCPSLTTLVGPNATTGTLNGGATVVTTGTTATSSKTITAVASATGIYVGEPVTDSGGAVPANTTVTGIKTNAVTGAISVFISNAATSASAGDTLTFDLSRTVTLIGSYVGVVAGSVVTDTTSGHGAYIPGGTTVVSINISPAGDTVTLSASATAASADTLNFAYPWGAAEMDWCAADGAIKKVVNDALTPVFTNYEVLLFPAGRMVANLPINFTCLNNGTSACPQGMPVNNGTLNVEFEGTISCNTGGLSCIDALGSTSLTLNNPKLYSPTCSTGESGIGVQFGRIGVNNEQAIFNYVVNASLDSSYGGKASCWSLTPYYNFGGEQALVQNSVFNNHDTNGGARSAILDGGNHYNIISPYLNEQLPHDTAVSFQGFQCLHCSFYPNGGTGNAGGVFIYNATNTNWDDAYIVSWDGGPAFTVYAVGSGTINALHDFTFKGNIEGTLSSDFAFVSASAAAQKISNLRFITYNQNATTSVFQIGTNTTAVQLPGLEVRISQSSASVPLFDNGSAYTITDLDGIHINGTYGSIYPLSGFATAVNSTMGGGSAVCTGLGAAGTCTIATNSSPSAGLITLTTDTSGAANVGTVNLAFPFAMGTAPSCAFTMANGSGAWATGANVTTSAISSSNLNITWHNNATALANSTAFGISYKCDSRP